MKQTIKTKIFKILPIWLSCLAVILAINGAAVLAMQNAQPTIIPQLKEGFSPKVLGASASIRGDTLENTSALTKISEPDTSKISAKSFLVFNLENGDDLLSKNPDSKLSIASLTKLLTGFVAYNNADLNKTFVVDYKDAENISPVLGLALGDEVKALDIFNAMLVGSNNDAAKALSNFVSKTTGKNFVSLMNEETEQLGMNNSHFSNPLGFDSQYNYSTAHDLKLLIRETQKLAAFTNLGRRTSYEFSTQKRNYSTPATNKLLKDHPEISAIKTGFTSNSGGAMASKLDIEGHSVVILVLGSADREADTLELEKIIFQYFQI